VIYLNKKRIKNNFYLSEIEAVNLILNRKDTFEVIFLFRKFKDLFNATNLGSKKSFLNQRWIFLVLEAKN
jgi:hypothetical protein